MRHSIEHFLNRHITALLRLDLMLIQLRLQSFLMFSIAVLGVLYFDLCFLEAGDFSSNDLISVHKPDRFVLILSEVTTHLQNVNIMHLLNVVANLVALFVTVAIDIIVLNHLVIVALCAIIVLDRGLGLASPLLGQRGIKLNYDRFSDTCLRPDASLDELDSLPVTVILVFVCFQVRVLHYFNVVILL